MAIFYQCVICRMTTNLTFFDFIIGISGSLIASIIFIFVLLFFFRPSFKICPFVIKQKDTFDRVGDIFYQFKIINTSLFSAYDIHVELNSLVSYPGKGGINFRFSPLILKTNQLNFVAPYRPKWWRKEYSSYAMLFRSYDNLENILEHERNSIQIQVTARHGLTGLSNVFNMEFVTINDIKVGQYTVGKKFNIV